MSAGQTLRQLQLAVLFGGCSGERRVSLASARTVLDTLREGGYEPLPIDTAEPRWWEALEGIELAFNIQHGSGGEDGVTQGLLQAMGIVGTGSDVLGSALAMDKLRSKQLWQAAGLPTADFVVLDDQLDAAAVLDRWGAAFIKPATEGSSLGMARVDTPAAFQAARLEAARYDACVLAERLIDGPEYTVAILGDRALPAIRIEAAREFYDYAAKYEAGTTRYHIPCGLDEDDARALGELALQAFAALGCSVWGRVDVMRDSSGAFQLLEVNTVPGMTASSLVPMAARAAGLTLLELLEEIMLRSWEAGCSASGVKG
jgi:D-alanine-D-alanine ligase